MNESIKIKNFEQYLDWLEENRHLFPQKRVRPRPPRHPGEILLEDYLKKLGMTQLELSHRLGCSFAKVNEVVHGKRGITPAFALQLEKVLEVPAEVWISLQGSYDLWIERKKKG